MHQSQGQIQDATAVQAATRSCPHRSAELGCPVDARVEDRIPEMILRGLQTEAVEMALDAAHIGALCEQTCSAVRPLLEMVGRAAGEEAADRHKTPSGGDVDVLPFPTRKGINGLPRAATEPARHAYLLVRAAYRLRQARTTAALWQAVDGNKGCWIALRAAIADGRVVLPAVRRRQVVRFADYVEQETRTTRPVCDRTVEAFIRLDRTAAKWLTEDATNRVAAVWGADVLVAAE